jgi:uncharacterized UPF0160 family protein
VQVLDTLDAVLDVGGVYDPERDRYDHHQRAFSEVFGHGFTTKLSSAGLVYKVRFLVQSVCEIGTASLPSFGYFQLEQFTGDVNLCLIMYSKSDQ